MYPASLPSVWPKAWRQKRSVKAASSAAGPFQAWAAPWAKP